MDPPDEAVHDHGPAAGRGERGPCRDNAPCQSYCTDGISLVPPLTGRGTQKDHEYLYWEFHGPSNRVEDRDVLRRHRYPLPKPGGRGAAADPWGQQQAIRIGDYVGLRAQIKSADDPLQLFDVVHDPHENTDLAGRPEHAALFARMKKRLAQAHTPQPGNPWPYDR